MKNFYVFGAHSRARTTATYLMGIDSDNAASAYLIDDDEDNENEIEGIPVLDLRTSPKLDSSLPVYIGTRGVNFDHATEVLRGLGFTEIYPVNIDLDTELRTKYFKKKYEREGRAFVKIDDIEPKSISDKPEVCIYEVRSIFDKPLVKDTYEKTEYEKSIQVGTSLADRRLEECDHFDNDGDNISDSNRQLCEETALYWIWKHATKDIVGLVHYRRHFILPERWVERMVSGDVDIITTLPLYVGPSVEQNYRFRHVSDDWDAMLEGLKKYHPEYLEAAEKVFSNTIYHPCNMLIMKRDILMEYCDWLFPILFYMKEKTGWREDTYQNRYPAFMAERLFTLFCYKNWDRLNIVFADKNFLQ